MSRFHTRYLIAALALAPACARAPGPLVINDALQGRLVVDDALREATQGTRRGGQFVEDGWKITAFDDSIVWHIPTVRKGAVEFSVAGLHPKECRPGMGGKSELFHMYDWTSGDADRAYAPPGGGGYRNNPFKHFLRKTNCLDTRPGKTDSLEVLLKIHDNYEEPDTRALAWDPAKAYRFRVEWGPHGAGNCEMKISRDGVLLRTMRQPGEWAPQGHSVRIGSSNRRGRDEEAPLDAVYSDVKVWDLAEAGTAAPSDPAAAAPKRPPAAEAPPASDAGRPSASVPPPTPRAGETLYNGIVLPEEWPPKLTEFSAEPMNVPYLGTRPEIVPIDVGRQLFVDDFLIEKTTLKRTFHHATLHPDCPIIKADKPWERVEDKPYAMVFSDGVWYDPADAMFKMWYMGGYVASVCYATSQDGLHWDKPELDVFPGTNMVQKRHRDSTTIWLDLNEKDKSKRFKMLWTFRDSNVWQPGISFSPDGIHWADPIIAPGVKGDRSTMFYNPFRGRWVYSLRWVDPVLDRTRHYLECKTLEEGLPRTPKESTLWTSADRLDPRNPDPKLKDVIPQLYNLDCAAYESLLLGFFAIWEGHPEGGQDKRNELLLGFSRDGFHWHRPDRTPFVGVNETEGAWNYTNVQSTGGGCLVMGDQLYFYVSGRGRRKAVDPAVTGLATLRRDGFASMDATDSVGELLTRPVLFTGKYLFVNADVPQGELRVEVLDKIGQTIAPFSRETCTPVSTDSTLHSVRWSGASDLSALAGQTVRFRFHVKNGRLYSFWVSPDESGASYGYVAAGGPGFTEPRDTAGTAAYQAARKVAGIQRK